MGWLGSTLAERILHPGCLPPTRLWFTVRLRQLFGEGNAQQPVPEGCSALRGWEAPWCWRGEERYPGPNGSPREAGCLQHDSSAWERRAREEPRRAEDQVGQDSRRALEGDRSCWVQPAAASGPWGRLSPPVAAAAPLVCSGWRSGDRPGLVGRAHSVTGLVPSGGHCPQSGTCGTPCSSGSGPHQAPSLLGCCSYSAGGILGAEGSEGFWGGGAAQGQG